VLTMTSILTKVKILLYKKICIDKARFKLLLSYILREVLFIVSLMFLVFISIVLWNIFFGDVILCDSIPELNIANPESVSQNQGENLSSDSQSYTSNIKCLYLHNKCKLLQGLKNGIKKNIDLGVHKFYLAKRTFSWFLKPSKRGGGRGL